MMAKAKCLSASRHRKKPERCLIGLGGHRAEAIGLSRGLHLLDYLLLEVVGRRFRCSGLSGFSREKVNAVAD